jgi:predicted membrane channel-forming protein YqfA (hemolysin III family)
MEGPNILTLRDSTVIAIVDIFGISYFSLFTLQCLLFQFPVSHADISNSLATLLFGVGVVSWCFLSLAYRILLVLGSTNACYWEKLEFGGILLLIYATTISYVALQFSTHSLVQLGYICAISLLFVGHLVEVLVQTPGTPVSSVKFQYHCTSFGLLALVPIIHGLAGPLGQPVPLTLEVARVAVYNGLGAMQYFVRPLERMGLFQGWQPSLYIMHLVLVYSAVMLSSNILPAVH